MSLALFCRMVGWRSRLRDSSSNPEKFQKLIFSIFSDHRLENCVTTKSEHCVSSYPWILALYTKIFSQKITPLPNLETSPNRRIALFLRSVGAEKPFATFFLIKFKCGSIGATFEVIWKANATVLDTTTGLFIDNWGFVNEQLEKKKAKVASLRQILGGGWTLASVNQF